MHSYAATIDFVFSVASASLSIFLSGCHIIIALLYARLIATSSPCPFSRPSTSYGVRGSVPISMVQAPVLLAFRMHPCVPPEPTPEQYHIQGLKSWAGTSAGVGERALQEIASGVPQQTQPSLCAFGFASLCGRPFGAIGEGRAHEMCECLVSTRFQMARHDAHLTSLRF